MNAFADLTEYLLWDVDMRDWLDHAASAIDVIAIDHYPGTYTASACDEWGPLDTLVGIMQDYGKEGAITEVGYAGSIWTNIQAAWALCMMATIRQRTNSNNALRPTTPIILASWYELVDEDSDNFIEPLKHFGLVFSPPDLGAKDAYIVVRGSLPDFGF